MAWYRWALDSIFEAREASHHIVATAVCILAGVQSEGINLGMVYQRQSVRLG